MSVKRQQGSGDQVDLFDQALKASRRHGATGAGGTGAGACAELQTFTAWEQQRALTRMLMEEIAVSANLNQAYRRVKANKGAAGVDAGVEAMSVAELLPWIRENRERLIASLLDGS
jgi:RNA-directed DNA polymerase